MPLNPLFLWKRLAGNIPIMFNETPTLTPLFKYTLLSFLPTPFFLRVQQEAAAWASPEENVITKKTGWRRRRLTKRLRHQERNDTCVGGDYVPAWSLEPQRLLPWSGSRAPLTQRAAFLRLETSACLPRWRRKQFVAVQHNVIYTQSCRDNRHPAQRRAGFWQPNHTENRNNEQRRTRPGRGKMAHVDPSCCTNANEENKKMVTSVCGRHRQPWPSTRQGEGEKKP